MVVFALGVLCLPLYALYKTGIPSVDRFMEVVSYGYDSCR